MGSGMLCGIPLWQVYGRVDPVGCVMACYYVEWLPHVKRMPNQVGP